MLTKSDIEEGKKQFPVKLPYHERALAHDDCILIAYLWLDAQTKLRHPSRARPRPFKYLIERWAGRYISQNDVMIAAYLHPDVIGDYPIYNIAQVLVEPSLHRLEGIKIAFSQLKYRTLHDKKSYKSQEESPIESDSVG